MRSLRCNGHGNRVGCGNRLHNGLGGWKRFLRWFLQGYRLLNRYFFRWYGLLCKGRGNDQGRHTGGGDGHEERIIILTPALWVGCAVPEHTPKVGAIPRHWVHNIVRLESDFEPGLFHVHKFHRASTGFDAPNANKFIG